MNRRGFIKLLALTPLICVSTEADDKELNYIEIPNYTNNTRQNELVVNGDFDTDLDGRMINGGSAYTYSMPGNGIVVLEHPLSDTDIELINSDQSLITRLHKETK